MKRVDYLLLHLIKELGIEEGIRLSQIKKDWDNLFDEPLTTHLSPYKLSEGQLLIYVDSPIWLQELQYFKEDIIKKLSHLGVKDVRFRLGKVSKRLLSGRGKGQEKGKTLSETERLFIEQTVSSIKDEQLRGAVTKAITKALLKGPLS